MITFDPAELKDRLAKAIAGLREFIDIEWIPVDDADFDPASFQDQRVTESTVIEDISLPRTEFGFSLTVKELLDWCVELAAGKLVERREFRTPRRTLVYVVPENELAHIIAEAGEDLPEQTVEVGGEEYTIRTRLMSSEAMKADARFIEGLVELVEDQRIFQKDSEAIKLAVETCCDARVLAASAPACLSDLRLVKEGTKADEKKRALQKFADCLSATRNQIVHAKTNFTPKGFECPEAQLPELAACARVAAH